MKIAIITATYPPYHGGTGNVCAAHAQGLRALGHEVHIFTVGNGESNDHVHRLRPLLRLGNGYFLPQLLWRLRGFDIVHWHYPFFGGEVTALAAWLTDTPLIVTYHQDVILGGWLGRLAAILERTIGIGALQSAEKVLFTSRDYAQHSKMRRYLKPAQMDALSNGVDAARFAAPAPAAHPHFAAEAFTLLVVAGLDAAHYFKGVSNLLQAVAQTEAVRLVIVGDGALRPQYAAEATQLGLASRVVFAGHVSDAELPRYYQCADATVLPSTTMGEAFGLVLVESLAAGTPVIASNLPGVRTVVTDGVDGWLVAAGSVADLAAKIGRMQALPPAARAQMGRQGQRKVAQQYAWQHVCKQLDACYRVLVRRSTSSRI